MLSTEAGGEVGSCGKDAGPGAGRLAQRRVSKLARREAAKVPQSHGGRCWTCDGCEPRMKRCAVIVESPEWMASRWKPSGENLEANLAAVARRASGQIYRPQPVRRVWIPKPDGDQRPLGIPAVRDRVVQQVVRQVLEPIVEAQFSPYSHGFQYVQRLA